MKRKFYKIKCLIFHGGKWNWVKTTHGIVSDVDLETVVLRTRRIKLKMLCVANSTVEGTAKVVKSKCRLPSVIVACDTLVPGPRWLLTDPARTQSLSSEPKIRRGEGGEFGKRTSGSVGFSLTFLSIPGHWAGRRQVKGQSSFGSLVGSSLSLSLCLWITSWGIFEVIRKRRNPFMIGK